MWNFSSGACIRLFQKSKQGIAPPSLEIQDALVLGTKAEAVEYRDDDVDGAVGIQVMRRVGGDFGQISRQSVTWHVDSNTTKTVFLQIQPVRLKITRASGRAVQKHHRLQVCWEE